MESSIFGLLGIFLSGLALNLTPCVYPLIPVTAALFSHEGKHPRISFLKAVFYVLGISITYSSLGLFAALTGGLFGAILQNPVVLFGIALFMFFLALGMFGVYDLILPPEALQSLSKRRVGFAGIFLSGAFVGLFAAPCIGPFIIGLLADVAKAGDPVFGFTRFFALSLGLGFPYLIFGTYAGTIKKLPKSGEWLVWVKKIFGFMLLERAIFYLNSAFYPELLPYGVPAILIVGGVYLGFMDTLGDKIAKFTSLKRLAGALALAIGIFLIFSKPKVGVVWDAYSPEKLKAAQTEQKPVVIDFAADWCLPCHELERYTYTDPEVIKRLNAFVKLKVDATNPDTDEAQEPIDKFDIQGVPTVLFLDPAGKEIPKTRVTGFVPASEFLMRLDKVESTFKKEAKDDRPK